MPVVLRTTLLLIGSNIFMTFAWYAHLKNLNDRKWYIAALAELGHRVCSNICFRFRQTASVTLSSAWRSSKITAGSDHSFGFRTRLPCLYMREPMKLDYLWAGLCLLGAVYFMFRS